MCFTYTRFGVYGLSEEIVVIFLFLAGGVEGALFLPEMGCSTLEYTLIEKRTNKVTLDGETLVRALCFYRLKMEGDNCYLRGFDTEVIC